MANNKFLGTDLLVYIDGEPIAHSRKASFKMNRQLADSTTKDSIEGWTESLESLKSWEVSTEGLAVWGDSGKWYDMITNGTAVTISFKPTTQESGDITFSGMAFAESVEINSEMGEVVTYSINFKGTGKLNAIPKA